MSENRIYLHKTSDADDSVVAQKFGGTYRVSGVLFQGEDKNILALLPNHALKLDQLNIMTPNDAEWSLLIHYSDDPQYYDDIGKVWHRKARRVISAKIRQFIWARDGFKCMYCGAEMGDVLLTVDHFLPLELGGTDEVSNYLSACEACNNQKGAVHPSDYCLSQGLYFNSYCSYLGVGNENSSD